MSTLDTRALLLAGGAGTRFWPASRAKRPKQLLAIAGDVPLLRATALRVLPIVGGWERIWISTGADLVEPILKVLPEVDRARILVEPVARNTAPCIAWAAAAIAREDPSAIVVVLPSDHFIADVPRFHAALTAAIASARAGTTTTIGIRPTHPETGYGYIELGDGTTSTGARLVERFVEKPKREVAEAFLASGKHLWNAGMFFFRAGDMIAAVREHLPALEPVLGPDAIARFAEMPSISIDHGVMEKMATLAVVPGDFGWSDIGSWQSAHELAAKDADGNTAPEGTILAGARDNHVVDLRTKSGEKRVIALVGVEGLVVVATDDALLVVPSDRSQDVKTVVERLRARGDDDLV